MFLKTVNLLSLILLMVSAATAQESEHLKYIERYKEIAIREMERAGIPASIKLAQGLLESNAGQSWLARNANNHFGIKCGNDWDGKKVYQKDDDYNDEGKLVESCFRSYKNADASFIAHSEFLRDPRKEYRYGFLFRIDPTDYKAWAEGLRRAGYATSANYHLKLIDIIERYDLHRFDLMSSVEIIADAGVSNQGEDAVVRPGLEFENNDVRYVLAKAEETPAQIAERTSVRLGEILSYNEGLKDRNQKLDEGMVVYLQPKRKSFRGKRTWHYVKEGDNMYAISQIYGIKLDALYKRNRMSEEAQPAVGERIKIRGCKVKDRPKLASEVKPAPSENKPVINVPDENNDGLLDMEEELEDVTPTPPKTTPPPPPPVKVEPQPEPTPPKVEPPQPPVQPVPTVDPQPEPPAVPVEPQETTPPALVYHTVAAGDTLYNISKRYNTTVEAIKRLNNLTSNTINIGQRLRVK
ncbi:MAG: LysM peptidoglycan-binding domain-containing protein [Phaeodactylibacter sp.]|nr:LysM peptidoglycan-binding domain-containing protein [Phaeodactylibacter sp.]